MNQNQKNTHLSAASIDSMLEILSECFPNPKSELNFKNPFELLCAVVLSAQTTDESVNKVTPRLFEKAHTPCEMASLGAEGIAPLIESIGLWRGKSRNLAALSKIIAEKFDKDRKSVV